MTLDEIEELARDYAHLTDPMDPWPAEWLGDLARALLAVLPVIRAAEAWHRVNTGQHTNGPQHTLAMRDTRNALVAAIDTMREVLR